MPRPALAIVDDDAAQLELSSFALRRVLPAVEIRPVHLGRGQALQLDPAVDLVLVDYLLGGTTATRLLPELRRIVGPDVPLVVFSNTTEPRVEREVVAAGAAALVGKPFSLEGMRTLVARLGEFSPCLQPDGG